MVKKSVKAKSKKSPVKKPKKGSIRKGAGAKKKHLTKKAQTKKARVKKSTSRSTKKKQVAVKKPVAKKSEPRFNITQDDKNINRYMQMAMDTERKAIAFYTKAKKQVNDFNMTKFLDMLIEQERIHLMFFTQVYDAEKKKGSAEAGKSAAAYKGQKPVESPLFKDIPENKMKKKVASINQIFKEALELEVHGHDMYLYMARRVKNPKIKKFLKMIAAEELKHRDFIHEHQDAIYDTGFWLGLEHTRLET